MAAFGRVGSSHGCYTNVIVLVLLLESGRLKTLFNTFVLSLRASVPSMSSIHRLRLHLNPPWTNRTKWPRRKRQELRGISVPFGKAGPDAGQEVVEADAKMLGDSRVVQPSVVVFYADAARPRHGHGAPFPEPSPPPPPHSRSYISLVCYAHVHA
ncbi:hypothetical protein BC567DRAFT_42213 [Phyllosticta citribraziliensis]